MYNYVYITGAVIIFPLWLLFFLKRKDLRKEMLIIGIWVATLAIVFEFVWFLRDYWDPLKFVSPLNFIWQEVIFGVFMGGILSVAYEFLFNIKSENKSFNIKNFLLILLVLVFDQILFVNLLKINSIYANIIGFISGLGIILFTNPKLAANAMTSGLASLVIVLEGYLILLLIYPNLIQDWWCLENLSGMFVWKIPIEELIWFTSFDLATGPLYKFWYFPS